MEQSVVQVLTVWRLGELSASGVVTFAIDVDAEFAATAIGTAVRRVKSAEVVARTVG